MVISAYNIYSAGYNIIRLSLELTRTKTGRRDATMSRKWRKCRVINKYIVSYRPN